MTNPAVALAMPLTKVSEGVRLKAYLDAVGVPTIGYGHTKGVRMGQVCTMAQALAWLQEDLLEAQRAVRRLVKVPLTAHQEAALIDFVFNLGAGRLAESTLLRLLNAGNYAAVPAQLRRWNKGRVKGRMVVLRGLSIRREAEIVLWSTRA